MKSVAKIFGALAIVALLGSGAHSAIAQTSPSGMSGVQGATTGLGTSHRFASPNAAMAHCPGDAIVWASGSKLTYATQGAAGYGKSGSGFYACKAEADGAGFQPGG